MPVCAVKSCHNCVGKPCSNAKITFHRFPTDPELAHAWIEIIRKTRNQDHWKPHKTSVVCSDHFSDEDLYFTKKGFRRVKNGLVPSQRLYVSESEDSSEAETESSTYIKQQISPAFNMDIDITQKHGTEARPSCSEKPKMGPDYYPALPHSTSLVQLSALMDFVEKHPAMARGYNSRTIEGRYQTARLWSECGHILNSLSAHGVLKSVDNWRTYFNEFKSRTLRKIKLMKSDAGNKRLTLSSNQKRLYKLLGGDVRDIRPKVHRNNRISEEHDYDRSPSPFSSEMSHTMKEEESEPAVVVETPAMETRRRRHVRSQATTEASIRSAIETLIAMKKQSAAVAMKQASFLRCHASALSEQATAISEHAAAVREHAAAMNRLSAAIENIGPQFIDTL